jgi:uncharacterized protein (DUF1684 family)
MDELELADWRRRVAEMYARWRAGSVNDPVTATGDLRRTRDALFREHPQSPLPQERRARFGGLAYFDYDPAYRFTAVLEPATDLPASQALAIALPTSGDEPFSFQRIGHVRLAGPLAGATLPVFWMTGYAGGLFLPFRDATAGTETYGAGRYLLDTVKGADQGGDWKRAELLLDFNLAYHPSCAYDPRWNCPLAPPESRLAQPVRAGERLGEQHA